MNPWRPYLLEVLGEGKEATARVDETETLIRSLRSRHLTANDLLRLIDWLEKLDAFRQLFVLPSLLDLLTDPARSLRSRILRFAGELVGASFESLLAEVDRLMGTKRDASARLRKVLEEFAAIPQPPTDEEAGADDLATLLTERANVFALSLLTGIHGWIASRPDAASLTGAYSDFFAEDEQKAARAALLELLGGGSPFVRHLVARWLGRTAIGLDTDPRQLLFSRYCKDPAAAVAASALEAYAEITTDAEVAATTQRLETELRTCGERQARFGGSTVVAAGDAARVLTAAVLRAIGTLARRHPSQPEPLAALCRVVTTRPTSRLDLHCNPSVAARKTVLECALALHGALLLFKVRDLRREKGVLVGDLGTGEAQAFEEPPASLPRTDVYWCELAAATDPQRRLFRLVEPSKKHESVRTTGDLLGVVAPRIDAMATCKSPRRSDMRLRGPCETEIRARATWSSAAVDAVASALLAARPVAAADGTADLDALLAFMVETAEAAEQVPFTESRIGADGMALRGRTRGLLLNDFAHDDFFARLFAGGEADEVRASLLAALATSALRALDDDDSYRWITGNLELLRRIATSDSYPLRIRGAAAAAVELRIRGLAEADAPPVVVDTSAERLHGDGRRALPFVPDLVLQEVYERLDANSDHGLLRTRPETAPNSIEQVTVRAEVIVRALEGRAGEGAAEKDVAICLAAAASLQRDKLLPDSARRRLAAAFVKAPAERRTALVRRLFELLLRTATSAQLMAVLRLAHRRAEPAMEQYLGRLMERRLESDPDATLDVGLGRFDVQRIVDAAARRTVPLIHLHRLARAGQSDFVRDFLARRRERLGRRETDRTIAAVGSVRRIGRVEDDTLAVELRPIRPGEPAANLAASAVDVVPSFVHHPPGQVDVRCLAALHRTPPETLDLHVTILSPEDRRALLDEMLVGRESILLAARVVGETAQGRRRRFDLGVQAAGLPRRPPLELDREVAPDDIVVVRLWRERDRRLVVTAGSFRLVADAAGDAVADLRGPVSAVRWLKERADREPLHLRCRVVDQVPRADGNVRCFCEAGFLLDGRPKGRHPSFVVDAAAVPDNGDEVVIEASELTFAYVDAPGELRDSVAVLEPAGGLQEGQLLSGYLRRDGSPGERRTWFAEVGGCHLAVPRRCLTRDLRRLFELDELPNDAPFLARLGKELTPLVVQRGGAEASVVDAVPTWTVDDLTVAVAGGAVEQVTVVGADRQVPRGMVVEVAGVTPLAAELGDSAVVGIGTLAYVRQGDLFDQRGDPVTVDNLLPGTRLSLAVWEQDGETADHGARPRPPIHLRLAEEPDTENHRLETRLEENSVVRVQVDADGSKWLVDALPGLPPPRVELAPQTDPKSFPRDSVVEALVARRWDPWSTDHRVLVRGVRSIRLPIDDVRRLDEVRFFLDLKPGDLIDKFYEYRRMHDRLVCMTAALRVEIDSLTPYLLPSFQRLRPPEIRRPVRLTQVVNQWPRRNWERWPASALGRLVAHPVVTGLVDSVPVPGSSWKRITVSWGVRDRHGALGKLEQLPSPDVGKEYQNGDVLTARLSGADVVIDRQTRLLRGTFLHTAIDGADWIGRARKERRELIHAVILALPEDAAGAWLLCVEPADLVSIRASDLRVAPEIVDVEPLDRVKLRRTVGTDGSSALLLAEHEDGILAGAVGRRFDLRVMHYDRHAGLFGAELAGGGALADYPPLRLELSHDELPPGVDRRQLMRAGEKVQIPCTLEGFELVTQCDDDDLYDFKLVCRLGRYDVREEARPKFVKPALEAALAERGRLDGVHGKVELLDRAVRADDPDGPGEDLLGVRLNRFAHDAALPLPMAEQTWLPLTGQLPQPGASYAFTVLRAGDGALVASLRRSRPRTLAEWLAARSVRGSSKSSSSRSDSARADSSRIRLPLRYFGSLSAKDREECGISATPAAEDESGEAGETEVGELVLFEVGPGETFVARPEELRFLGEPFDPKALHVGDEITEVDVLLVRSEGEEVECPVLDILDFNLDIVVGIGELKRGSHFGKVRVSGRRVEIVELRGVGSTDTVKPRRLGRWRLALEEVSPADLERLVHLDEDHLVYLKFQRAEPERRTLFFRLATTEEIFALNNLVYVAAERVSPHGASWKLEVRPLDRHLKGSYFIADTQFSARLGRLQSFDPAREGSSIFLARVRKTPEEGLEPGRQRSSYELTLLRNPRRRFRYMMSHHEWQVIVTGTREDGKALYAEAGIGVQVELPLRRIGLSDRKLPRPGEILFLDRDWDNRALVVRDSVPSHLHYLAVDSHPLVLATLWGNSSYRRRKLEEGRNDCSVVGLAQLHGVTRIGPESIESDEPLPRRVERLSPDVNYVELSDRLASAAETVGRLSFDEAGRARFESQSTGTTYFPAREQVTHREGTAREVAAAVAANRWRDGHGARHPDHGIDRALLIARTLPEEGLSLTSMAERPLPVDHLVEQLAELRAASKGAGRERTRPRSFVVARSEPGRLILEIAPGRYAELPTALMRPLFSDGTLGEGLTLSWERLAAGDELSLELLISPDRDAFLPRFRVLDLIARSGRQLARPVAVALTRRDDGSLVLGNAEGPGVPAPTAAGKLLQNARHDLKDLAAPLERGAELLSLFDRHGSRLLLVATVIGSTQGRGGTLLFLDIGIRIRIDGKDRDPVLWVADGEPGPAVGQRVGVRILAAVLDGIRVARLEYEVEPLVPHSTRALVRGTGAALARTRLPSRGDSLLVYQPAGVASEQAVAAGFEDLELLWQASEGDDLHLDQADERAKLFEHLLAGGAHFWATCEGVGERHLTVSRRLQLEEALPEPGRVVRLKLQRAVSNNRWLARLHDVPVVIPSQRLFRGQVYAARRVGQEYERLAPRGLDIEVVRAQDGRLSAVEVYTLPAASELETRIEAVVDGGVMVIGAGCRLFVPVNELAWCGPMNEALLHKLFKRGDRLRVARRADRDDRWSHVRIYDIRTDVAEMTRSRGAVSVTAFAVDEGRTIARAPSGVLMELVGSEPPEVGTRLVAFVQEVDKVNRRILLASEEAPRRTWSLPPPAETSAIGFATLADPAFRAWVQDLKERAAAGEPTAAFAWAGRHRALPTDPETVRIVLDALGPRATLVCPPEAEGGKTESRLQQLLRRLANAAARNAESAELPPEVHFALGYQNLINGDPEPAARHLHLVAAAGAFPHSFAASLALAVAYTHTGDETRAAAILRELLDRLWSNALRTLPLPLIEPPFVDPQDEAQQLWQQCLARGDLRELARIMGQQPAAFRTSAAGLAFQIWYTVVEGRLERLDDVADQFFAALRQDCEEVGETALDARVFAMAALLEFARGRVIEGWGWLDRLATGGPDMKVAAFWARQLGGERAGDEGIDPVLVAAVAAYRRCRWDQKVDRSLLDSLWQRFRASRHRWILDGPICRPLTPLPAGDAAAIARWVKFNGMESALNDLLEEMDLASGAVGG